MKITKEKLQQIIQEELLKEVGGASDAHQMDLKDQKELADDMEFLLKKLLSPKIQEVLYKYMHPRFLEMVQEKVHNFKMHAYSRQLGGEDN